MPALLDWLRATPGSVPVPVPPPVQEDDPYTLPLALASVAHDRTISLLDDEPEGRTRPYDKDADPWASEPVDRVPLPQRLRRGVLLVSTAGAVAAGLTVYPWLGSAALVLVVWVLRSASLAASATGDRRRLRGAKWYDPVLYLVGAPWHAVRSIPGTLLLALWSIGLAVAAVLVCYAFAASVEVTLLSAGLVLVFSLWLGPGGSRVRGPLSRVVNPLSVRLGPWLAAEAVVVAASCVLGFVVAESGPNWAPDNDAPLSQLDLDGAGRIFGR
jgi:hypothetical protein